MKSPGEDNPYVRLGVSPGVSISEIKKAYRRAAQKYHPDRNQGDPGAHDNFLLVQQAYQWLLQAPRGQPYEYVPDDEDEYVPPSEKAADTVDIPIQSEPDRMDGSASFVLWVRLDSLSEDRDHLLSLSLAQPCGMCKGDRLDCAGCKGTGQVYRTKKWMMRVPARTRDGAWLLGRGMGHRGHRLRAPGDLRVQVRWKDAGLWKWENDRIVGYIPISSRRLKLGGNKAIRMPDGRWVWWNIPPGTKIGQEFNWPNMNWGGKPCDVWLVVEQGKSLFDIRGRRRR